jgi:hypothetical protein
LGTLNAVKAEVEYTALVSVKVDLETGEVASFGINATRDTDETPSEVSVVRGFRPGLACLGRDRRAVSLLQQERCCDSAIRRTARVTHAILSAPMWSIDRDTPISDRRALSCGSAFLG